MPYPGGIAVATILKSPGAGIQKSIMLFGAAIVSALFALVVKTWLGYEDFDFGALWGAPERYSLVLYCSLMTVGVGFLSGKGGFWFGAGGFICYWLLSPILSMVGPAETQVLVEFPGQMRNAIYKPTGIGMLIGAALGGILMAFPLIRSAIGSMNRASKEGKHVDAARDGNANQDAGHGNRTGIGLPDVSGLSIGRKHVDRDRPGNDISGNSLDLDRRCNCCRVYWSDQLVSVIGDDPDCSHHPDCDCQRDRDGQDPNHRQQHGRRGGDLPGNFPGQRHDAGFEIRLPGGRCSQAGNRWPSSSERGWAPAP